MEKAATSVSRSGFDRKIIDEAQMLGAREKNFSKSLKEFASFEAENEDEDVFLEYKQRMKDN